MARTGFTLIEMAVVAGAAALLMAMALPSFQDRLTQARRLDATHALERIQFAQERHHALHGLYATDLRVLGSSGLSPEGLYDVTLDVGPGERYTAVARARTGSTQAHDTACLDISIRVEQGFATLGPTHRCWNR